MGKKSNCTRKGVNPNYELVDDPDPSGWRWCWLALIIYCGGFVLALNWSSDPWNSSQSPLFANLEDQIRELKIENERLREDNFKESVELANTGPQRLQIKRTSNMIPPLGLYEVHDVEVRVLPFAETNEFAKRFSYTSHGADAVAVFVQIGTQDVQDKPIINDVLRCVENTAQGAYMAADTIDVFISFIPWVPKKTRMRITDTLKKTVGIRRLYIVDVINRGGDIGAFIEQVTLTAELNLKYKFVLKMHTKTDYIWRNHLIESLCGTPAQTRAAIALLGDSSKAVSPIGLTFDASTKAWNIMPHLVRKYKFDEVGAQVTFSKHKAIKMWQKRLCPESSNGEYKLKIMAGSAYWCNFEKLHRDRLVEWRFELLDGLTEGEPPEDNGLEHILERAWPASCILGEEYSELAPAVKPMAIYFPQFHQIPENDDFWETGFTEWTFLRPFVDAWMDKLNNILYPLSIEEGGLGWYKLTDPKVRKRQRALARAAGIHGWSIYHYWFEGEVKAVPADHKVMYKVIEAMAFEDPVDDQLPFVLSWANEPWTRRWTGKSGKVLLDQDYGKETNWKEHFNYLLKFFKHPKYIKVDGRPAFIIYRSGHIAKKLKPMLSLWRELAVETGFPGLHLIDTFGNFMYDEDAGQKTGEEFDAGFHFWPQIRSETEPCLRNVDYQTLQGYKGGSSIRNCGPAKSWEDRILLPKLQYWGATAGFDNTPRTEWQNKTHIELLTVEKETLKKIFETSLKALHRTVARENKYNFYFLTAWNEWNEQAVLEPSTYLGFDALTTLNDALTARLASCPFNRTKLEADPGLT